MKKLLFLSAVIALGAAQSRAATYKIDAAHSSVGFKVRHMVVSKVRGRFTDFAGTVDYDPKDPKSWKTEAVIQTKSVDTDNDKRDDHLRTADFFEVEKYPTITFKSTKVKETGKGAMKVWGEFTMHGVTKTIELNVEFNGAVEDSWGNERIGFSATTKIDRMDYGVSFNKTLETGGLVVGSEVEIAIEIEALRKI